uniref:Exocyst complex component 3-like 2b n=1 Tax=Latimeria chalumnae TaxID=7897 RepID=H3ATL2_LATCH
MPVLKNTPIKLKMAKVNDEVDKPNGELILNGSTNPFEEDLEEDEKNPFFEEPSFEGKNPFEDENESLNSSLEGSNKKWGTLEKIGGLSPFKKLGKGKKNGVKQEKSPSNAVTEQEQGSQMKSTEKKKGRRSSEDMTQFLRFGGKRKESVGSLEPTSPEKDGDSDSKKRMPFLKIGRGSKSKRESLNEKLQHEVVEPTKEEEEVEKAKEPLSAPPVLEIHNLIRERELLVADQHIIELEEECEAANQKHVEGTEESKDGGRKAKDVTLLYEALQKELWSVVKESLTSITPNQQLVLVVKVIDLEEATDKRWSEQIKDSRTGLHSRPRELRKKWEEAVKSSVKECLSQCIDSNNGQITAYMDRLKKCAVEDLKTVKKCVIPSYPKEYSAFHVYMKSYHKGISTCLTDITNKKLEINELYSILDWVQNIYKREVLNCPDLAPLVHPQELGPLLPPETVHRLEEECITSVKTKTWTDMMSELEKEEGRWRQEATIEEFQSGLSIKIISILKIHVDRSSGITQELGEQIAHCCLNGLVDFLQSYQKKVDFFHEGQNEDALSSESYVSKTIATVNCCPPFREYVEHLCQFNPTESEEGRKKAVNALDKVESHGTKVLADRLFEDIKPYFNKVMKKKWLNHTEALDNITSTICDHFSKFKKMKKPPYQNLVNEVHHRVLMEYVKPLMQVRIVCSSSKMRKKMSARLREEAKQLRQLFKELDSTSSWLDVAVPHLAEIILLEDTPSIQMEVGVLVRDFPDIRKKHVSAILDVRGPLSPVVRQEILNIVKDFENSDSLIQLSRDRAFFSEIPITKEVRCININLNRANQSAITCLSMLRRSLRIRQRDETEDEVP